MTTIRGSNTDTDDRDLRQPDEESPMVLVVKYSYTASLNDPPFACECK